MNWHWGIPPALIYYRKTLKCPVSITWWTDRAYSAQWGVLVEVRLCGLVPVFLRLSGVHHCSSAGHLAAWWRGYLSDRALTQLYTAASPVFSQVQHPCDNDKLVETYFTTASQKTPPASTTDQWWFGESEERKRITLVKSASHRQDFDGERAYMYCVVELQLRCIHLKENQFPIALSWYLR